MMLHNLKLKYTMVSSFSFRIGFEGVRMFLVGKGACNDASRCKRTQFEFTLGFIRGYVLMILPQVHLRQPCYDFYFL